MATRHTIFFHTCSKLLTASFNPLHAELNPIRHLLALVGARHIVHVSRVRVKQAKIKPIFITIIEC